MTTKTNPRQSYHHGNLREALLKATREMLEQEGPDAVSLRAVARRAGVSQTAPYRHFASKDDLLAAVATQGFEEFGRRQARAVAAGEEGLPEMGVEYVLFAVENPALFQLMFGPHIGDRDSFPDLKRAGQASFEPIRQRMGGGGSPNDRPGGALAAWSMVHGLAQLMLGGRIGADLKTRGEREALIRDVLQYLATKPFG